MEAQLAQQQKSLESQLDIFQGLLKEDLADPSTVYFGDGYFVSLPVAEAKDFINRKTERLRQELSALNHFSGVNDEGLPILDIVEELDDDDKIVNSTLNHTGLGAQLAAIHPDKQVLANRVESEGNGTINHSTDNLIKKPVKLSETDQEVGNSCGYSEKSSDLSVHPVPVSTESVELLKDATTEGKTSEADTDPGNLSEYEFIEDVSLARSSRSSEDMSQGEYRDIDPAEILELELTNDCESDEEPIDFDFDYLEEEGDEAFGVADDEDDEDEDEFDDVDDEEDSDSHDNARHGSWISRAGSLFPQNESTRKLIEAHLKKQEKPIDLTASPTTSASSKNRPESQGKKVAKTSHVHFADSVDVRLFETSSKERKLTAADLAMKKPSRFRSLRQPTTANFNNTPLSRSSNKAGLSAAAAAAAAVVARSPTRPIITNKIGEREIPKSPIKNVSPNRVVGGPAPAGGQDIASPSKSTTRNSGSPVREKVAKLNADHANKLTSGMKETATNSDVNQTPFSSGSNVQASAILTPAQIKAKIASDAENYYDQSFVPDEDFLKLHDTDPTDQIDNQTKGSSKSQAENKTDCRPILSSSVIERIEKSDEDDHSEDDEELVDMKEIKREYQRLRQKLIYESGGYIKKPAEKEFEPIDPDGEPRKVSRFRAARIS